MHPVPHVDDPDPLITLRVEWQLFSARPVPIIPARMNRDELRQMIGEEGDSSQSEFDGHGSPAGRDTPELDSPTVPAGRDIPHGRDDTPGGNTAPAVHPIPAGSNSQTLSGRGDAKYRKPTGQPNRPLCGGYNLESHLVNKCGWDKTDFKTVQTHVHQLAAQKLDLAVSFRAQNAYVIQRICELVKQDHAVSRGYDASWPIVDMLRVHLKNTSEAERKREEQHLMQLDDFVEARGTSVAGVVYMSGGGALVLTGGARARGVRDALVVRVVGAHSASRGAGRGSASAAYAVPVAGCARPSMHECDSKALRASIVVTLTSTPAMSRLCPPRSVAHPPSLSPFHFFQDINKRDLDSNQLECIVTTVTPPVANSSENFKIQRGSPKIVIPPLPKAEVKQRRGKRAGPLLASVTHKVVILENSETKRRLAEAIAENLKLEESLAKARNTFAVEQEIAQMKGTPSVSTVVAEVPSDSAKEALLNITKELEQSKISAAKQASLQF
ncbi:hypothetical protein C8R46DRAFT_1205409 [Mycena filopes]|nr:hypothetical protein C8R46DRAFT_1205409 [Mycena filopes]